MAKKAAKKEAPAAKAKKAAAKPAKAPKKAAAKPAAKATKAPAKPAAKAKPAKEVKKAEKAEKVKPVAKEAVKKAAPVAAPVEVSESVSEKAPKKEKKIKIDKTGLTEDQIKWHELHEKYKAVKAPAYSISGQFEAKSPLQHKIFGWGYILSNEYDRLEVLFEDGKRMLISNRKLS